MKYIIRILTLPFALILWITFFSIKWIRYGGELRLNQSDKMVDPIVLTSLMKDLNTNLTILNEEMKIK